MDIAQSPISKTGNKVWDEVFNECFYMNMRTVMWSHHCMHDGHIYVARGQECSWCGAEEESEVNVENVALPYFKM
jgi:hypothetical protein